MGYGTETFRKVRPMTYFGAAASRPVLRDRMLLIHTGEQIIRPMSDGPVEVEEAGAHPLLDLRLCKDVKVRCYVVGDEDNKQLARTVAMSFAFYSSPKRGTTAAGEWILPDNGGADVWTIVPNTLREEVFSPEEAYQEEFKPDVLPESLEFVSLWCKVFQRPEYFTSPWRVRFEVWVNAYQNKLRRDKIAAIKPLRPEFDGKLFEKKLDLRKRASFHSALASQ